MTANYLCLVNHDQVWVAELDSTVVGLLVLQDMSDYTLLENIAVAARVRGTGVGRRLLEFANSQAMGLGHREIRLYTGAVMTQNLHYYPRHGYVETHRDFEDGHHRVYFTKVIRPD
jgi:N-acetylglutamate synthase-like GNAT family acetyltransferase